MSVPTTNTNGDSSRPPTNHTISSASSRKNSTILNIPMETGLSVPKNPKKAAKQIQKSIDGFEPIPKKSAIIKTDKPRPHVCVTCTRAFARLEHLKRHERSHTHEKPFQCAACGRCFARRDLVLRHQQKLHSGLSTNNPKDLKKGDNNLNIITNYGNKEMQLPTDDNNTANNNSNNNTNGNGANNNIESMSSVASTSSSSSSITSPNSRKSNLNKPKSELSSINGNEHSTRSSIDDYHNEHSTLFSHSRSRQAPQLKEPTYTIGNATTSAASTTMDPNHINQPPLKRQRHNSYSAASASSYTKKKPTPSLTNVHEIPEGPHQVGFATPQLSAQEMSNRAIMSGIDIQALGLQYDELESFDLDELNPKSQNNQQSRPENQDQNQIHHSNDSNIADQEFHRHNNPNNQPHEGNNHGIANGNSNLFVSKTGLPYNLGLSSNHSLNTPLLSEYMHMGYAGGGAGWYPKDQKVTFNLFSHESSKASTPKTNVNESSASSALENVEDQDKRRRLESIDHTQGFNDSGVNMRNIHSNSNGSINTNTTQTNTTTATSQSTHDSSQDEKSPAEDWLDEFINTAFEPNFVSDSKTLNNIGFTGSLSPASSKHSTGSPVVVASPGNIIAGNSPSVQGFVGSHNGSQHGSVSNNAVNNSTINNIAGVRGNSAAMTPTSSMMNLPPRPSSVGSAHGSVHGSITGPIPPNAAMAGNAVSKRGSRTNSIKYESPGAGPTTPNLSVGSPLNSLQNQHGYQGQNQGQIGQHGQIPPQQQQQQLLQQQPQQHPQSRHGGPIQNQNQSSHVHHQQNSTKNVNDIPSLFRSRQIDLFHNEVEINEEIKSRSWSLFTNELRSDILRLNNLSDDQFPSLIELNQYTTLYKNEFDKYFPFIHFPTLKPGLENYPLLLAIASTGALYGFHSTHAMLMFNITRFRIHEYLEREKKSFKNNNSIPLWTYQSMVLLIFIGIFNNDLNVTKTMSIFLNSLIELVKLTSLNLPLENFLTPPPIIDASPNSNESIQEQNYEYFILAQTRIRTCHTILLISNLFTSLIGLDCSLHSMDLKCGIHCKWEDLWRANNHTTWCEILNQHNYVIDSKFSLVELSNGNDTYTTCLNYLTLNKIVLEDDDHLNKRFQMKTMLSLLMSIHEKIYLERRQLRGEKNHVIAATKWRMNSRPIIESLIKSWESLYIKNGGVFYLNEASLSLIYNKNPILRLILPLLSFAKIRKCIRLTPIIEKIWKKDWEGMNQSSHVLHDDPEALKDATNYALDIVSLWIDYVSIQKDAEQTSLRTPVFFITCIFTSLLIISEFLNTVEKWSLTYSTSNPVFLNATERTLWLRTSILLKKIETQLLLSDTNKTYSEFLRLEAKGALDAPIVDDEVAKEAISPSTPIEDTVRVIRSSKLACRSLYLGVRILADAPIWPIAMLFAQALKARAIWCDKARAGWNSNRMVSPGGL